MIYIILAVLCIAATFTLNKLYQLKFCKGVGGLLLFPMVSAVIGWAFYFVLNGFSMHFSWVTFAFALLYSMTTTFNNVVGLVIMKHCKMSLYMSFLMIGGMFIPFLYGVLFLKEAFTPVRAIALIGLIVALLLPSLAKSEEKTSKKGLLLCLCVFISNGFVSTFSKMHQINSKALSTNDFMLWVNLFSLTFATTIFTVFQILQRKKETEKIEVDGETKTKERKTFLYGVALLVLIAVVNAVGALFNLTGAKTVDAAMLYPMITGGTIVLTSVAGWTIYREKINKFAVAGVVVALIGTILFAI